METELVKERGETYKVFNLGNRKKRYEVRCKPIHYTDEQTGVWKEIDVRLRLSTDIKKRRDNYLAYENRFTTGLRADKVRSKTIGIRYRGKKEYQFEITPETIVLGKDDINLPDTYSKFALLDDYNIENVIAPDVAIETKLHEVHTRAAVRTTRDIDDFRIVYKVDITGFQPKNEYKETRTGKEYIADGDNRFYFSSEGNNDIWIPEPKMWYGREYLGEILTRSERGIQHRLYEENGILYYEKTPTSEGKTFLKSHSGYLYIDADTYYGDTKDGKAYVRDTNWNTCHDATTPDYTDNNNSYYADGIAGWWNDAGSPELYEIQRSWFWFDTSGITDTDTITSAELKLYSYGSDAGNASLQESTQDDTLANWTFDAFTGSELASAYLHNYWSPQYETFTLSSYGSINKTGDSKYCIRERAADYLDSDPGTGGKKLGCYQADNSGTSKDPYLSIVAEASSQELTDSVSETLTITEASPESQFGISKSDTATITESTPASKYGISKSDTLTTTVSSPDGKYTLKTVTDTATMIEGTPISKFILDATDTMTGIEGTPISKYTVSVSDITSGTPDAIPKFILSITDTATGTESVAPISITSTVSDIATGTPDTSTKGFFAVSDTSSVSPSTPAGKYILQHGDGATGTPLQSSITDYHLSVFDTVTGTVYSPDLVIPLSVGTSISGTPIVLADTTYKLSIIDSVTGTPVSPTTLYSPSISTVTATGTVSAPTMLLSAADISTSSTLLPTVTKVLDIVSTVFDTVSGTGGISSGMYVPVSKTITGTPLVDKVVDYTKLIEDVLTGTPTTPAAKFLNSVSVTITGTEGISKTLSLTDLISQSITGSTNVSTNFLLSVLGTTTNSPTVEKSIGYTDEVSDIVTGTPTPPELAWILAKHGVISGTPDTSAIKQFNITAQTSATVTPATSVKFTVSVPTVSVTADIVDVLAAMYPNIITLGYAVEYGITVSSSAEYDITMDYENEYGITTGTSSEYSIELGYETEYGVTKDYLGDD